MQKFSLTLTVASALATELGIIKNCKDLTCRNSTIKMFIT